ncbi:MAG TPA: hypothetical protein VFA55_04705 [Candidatus Kapabacteria bacterium]|nr:hypothetical protein [Candidatus Kapabacteria bacterium]
MAFVRYENFDLNQSLAAHAVQDDNVVYNIITAGLTYKPIYNIAVKFDWQSQKTKAFSNSQNGASAVTNLDLGIGWMF